MRKCITFSLLILLTRLIIAQQVLVKKWDMRFGGEDNEGFLSFQQTTDGGYLLGGSSRSGIGGDITQPSRGGDDYWIVKIDSQGNKEWDKRFGGTGGEGIHILRPTSDKGYILGGTSSSGNNGDKTQLAWGGGDYWIVKIDSLGNKEWDKRFGGLLSDYLYAMVQTNDSGYILGGTSASGISGDKTQDNWDTTYFQRDGWVVKVDAQGDKEWDKRFGGTNYEDITSILQTNDEGYMFGGYSASDSNGDKTQPSWGSGDYWIVKIDSLGNKEWDRRYGGTNGEYFHSLIKTNDKGYVLGGYSNSGISGDKTKIGSQWILKIDTAGNKMWDKGFSGGGGEFNNFSQTSDGGYLIACRICGLDSGPDKSEANLGPCQAWVVKTDSLCNKQWDKTIFTTGFDGYSEAVETRDGCYAIAVGTNGGIGGYKTQQNWGGSYDYWIAKFCFEPVGVDDITEDTNILVYPNPFISDIAISLQKENLKEATFTISNMLGQVVFTKVENNLASSYTKMLDLSYLPNGIYLVEVTADGERVLKKVVKE